MLTKKEQRLRSRQTHPHCDASVARLTVNRTNLHIYASLISDDGSKVLATASTVEADIRKGSAAARAPPSPHSRSASASPRRRRLPASKGLRPRWFRLPRPRQGAGRAAAKPACKF